MKHNKQASKEDEKTKKKHEKARKKAKKAKKQTKAMKEQAKAEKKQMHETDDSAGAKRRGTSQHSVTGCPGFGGYIYLHNNSPTLS